MAGKRKLDSPKWTVVQHSGITTGHMEFARGLEVAQINTVTELELVTSNGGVVFDTFVEATAYEESESYPRGSGLAPQAPGTFARATLDGLRIYVPRDKPVQVTEEPVEFGGAVYVARRNAGESRWQVFRDGALAPVGFIERRHDPDHDEVRLFVYDATNTQLGESVHTYHNALSHLRMSHVV